MRVPFTSIRYERPERIADCVVGRWLLVVTLPLVAAALIAIWLDVDVLLTGTVLEVAAVTLFASSSASRPDAGSSRDPAVPVGLGAWMLRAGLIVLVPALLLGALALSV